MQTQCKVQTRVSLKQHKTRVLQMRISMPKREASIQSVPGCDFRISTAQCEACVLKQTLPKCEAQTRVSSQKHKVDVQSDML